MRAFVIDAIGDPGEVRIVDEPVPGDDEVLVAVRAVGLVASDWRIRDGSRHPRQEHRFPAVLGLDFAGELVAVPDGGRWSVGQRIFGIAHKPFIGAGSLADLVTMPADGPVAATPASLTDTDAAALVSGWLTSLATLDEVELDADAVVLLLGASGGVGSVLTQLLAARGAHVVAVTRAANEGYVRELGAADVVAYDEVDLVDEVARRWPAGVDVLVDLVNGRDGFAGLLELVRAGGQAVSGVAAADLAAEPARGVRLANVATRPDGARLEQLGTALADLRLPAVEVLPFAASRQGIDRLQDGHVRGKLVVRVGDG